MISPRTAVAIAADVTLPARHLLPEQELFLAVIALAVRDYRGEVMMVTGRNHEARIEMMQGYAEAWLFSPLHEKDFLSVCRLADLDPEFVRRCAQEAVRRPYRSPLDDRRARLRKALPATTEEILMRMPEYTTQTKRAKEHRESIMVRRDLRAIGAVRVDREWKVPA
jgi:hypothetical protein